MRKVHWKQFLDDAKASINDALATLNQPNHERGEKDFLLSDIADAKIALESILEDTDAPEKEKKLVKEALMSLESSNRDEQTALLHALSKLDQVVT